MMLRVKKTVKKQVKKSPANPVKKHYEASLESVNQIWAMTRTVRDMLMMLPDPDLSAAKREIGVVEDLLWQAISERR